MACSSQRRKIVVSILVSVTGLALLCVGTICAWLWFENDPPILYDPAPIYPGATKVIEEIDPLSGHGVREYQVKEDYEKVLSWYTTRLRTRTLGQEVPWVENSEGCSWTVTELPYLLLVSKRVRIEICPSVSIPSDTVIYTGTRYR